MKWLYLIENYCRYIVIEKINGKRQKSNKGDYKECYILDKGVFFLSNLIVVLE